MVNGIIGIMKKEVQIYSSNLLHFLNSNEKKTKHIFISWLLHFFYVVRNPYDSNLREVEDEVAKRKRWRSLERGKKDY